MAQAVQKLVGRFPVWFLFNPDVNPSGEILLQKQDSGSETRVNVFTIEETVKRFVSSFPQFARYVSVPLFSPGGLLYFLDIIERRGATHLAVDETSDEERLAPIALVRDEMRFR